MALSEKAKMLGFGLQARGVSKQNALTILLLLTLEDEIDDMVWFMGENPKADERTLLAVALQLDKESRDKGYKKNG